MPGPYSKLLLPWFLAVVPLLVILHHTLRLWSRKWWLVFCEVPASLLEAVTVCYFFGQDVRARIVLSRSEPETKASFALNVLTMGFTLVLMVSCSISFTFLSYDTLNGYGKTLRPILQPYDFFLGPCPHDLRWRFIFGRFTTRRRFSTDSMLIRWIRGGLAILSLLGLVWLTFYASIWQPLQWSDRPGAKVFKVPVTQGLPTLLQSILGLSFYGPDQEGLTVQAMLPVPVSFYSNPIMNMDVSFHNMGYRAQTPIEGSSCARPLFTGVVVAYCHPLPLINDYYQTGEILITIDFAGKQDDAQIFLGLRNPMDPEGLDILANAKSVGIGPGLNLHGWSSVSIKERFLDQKTATIGIPKYRRFAVLNVHTLSPDWVPSLPRDNNTATLRISVPSQWEVEIEQEYLEGSVLNGFALVGGIWTLVNGVFAAIFGSTLLLVLFGIKPLSIYGLVHIFRPGKGSLVDRGYVLSAAERDRTMGILREHLLDVDEAEEELATLTRYDRIAVSQRHNYSRRDVEAQM